VTPWQAGSWVSEPVELAFQGVGAATCQTAACAERWVDRTVGIVAEIDGDPAGRGFDRDSDLERMPSGTGMHDGVTRR
jgi:hypothetical protein